MTGVFPLDMILSDETRSKLDNLYVPSISEYDPELQLCWFIAREVIKKTSKNGRKFYVVEVIDSNSVITKIRCWSIKPEKDEIHLNRPYMLKPRYSADWGFSTYGAVSNSWFLLG